MSRIGKKLTGLVVPVLILLIWEILGLLHATPSYLPPPSDIARGYYELVRSGEIFWQSGYSLLRASIGFLLGALAGVAVGLLCGTVRPVRDLLEPVIIALNPVPKIAFLPVFIIAFGMGHGSKFAIIAMATFFPLFISTLQGMEAVPTRLIWAARSMGAGKFKILFQVCLPASTPSIFSGLRIAGALSFIVLFAAELMGSNTGLGYIITTAQDGTRFDLVMAAIITIGFLGFVSDRLLLSLRKVVLRYEAAAQGASR